MLAVGTPLKTRLEALPQLSGWDVRKWTEHTDRTVLPAAELRCVGAVPGGDKRGAVMLGPQWRVTLVLKRGDTAEQALDAAMSAVICSLQGWQPGQCGERGWEAFALVQITEPMLPDDTGQIGYELTFSTSGLYTGQQ